MDENELKKYNWSNPPSFALPRTKEMQAVYDSEYGSEKQRLFIVNLKNILSRKGFAFIPNTYPYNVVPPIKHSCLWYKGFFTPDNVVTYLNVNKIDYITFFENNVHNKSIKTISHYHIFHY